MEDDLVCNFKKCRKRINGVAWVKKRNCLASYYVKIIYIGDVMFSYP